MIDDELLDMIARHECIGGKPNLKAYKDSLGIWTIGYGHNVESKPITAKAARLIFLDDVKDAINECVHAFPWFMELDKKRQHVLIDMTFNMGLPRLKGFTKFLKAMELGDYETAANEMLDSLWAKQVKGRALELANMIRGTVRV